MLSSASFLVALPVPMTVYQERFNMPAEYDQELDQVSNWGLLMLVL